MATTKIILVVGMHRSGTSALTGILGTFGATVPLAANTRINADNPKGHWEHTEVNRINDDVLREFGMTWAAPGPIDMSRIPDRQKKRVLQFLQGTIAESDSDVLAYKDPRFCLLLPLWQEAIASLGHEPCIVFSYRAPDAVASSIASRNNLGYERGLYLWLEYNLRALISMRDCQSLKMAFPDWMSSARDLYDGLATQFEIKWNQPWESCATRADAFLDSSLVHNVAGSMSDSFLGKASTDLYSIVEAAPQGIAALNNQDDFSTFCARYLPALDSASALIQDERSLWREKINAIYYLINRNS